jgi:hypothetical protein
MKNFDPQLAVFTLKDIVSGRKPVLHVVHDVDGDWQFLTGEAVSMEEAVLVSMNNMLTLDHSLSQLLEMENGFEANRATIQAEWQITKSE